MALGFNPDRADTNETGYVSAILSVGTSQVEIKAGGSRLTGRQLVVVYNDSSNTVYFGPSGVTTSGSTKGVPVAKGQMVSVPIGNQAIYLIAGSSSNDVIVQEFA